MTFIRNQPKTDTKARQTSIKKQRSRKDQDKNQPKEEEITKIIQMNKTKQKNHLFEIRKKQAKTKYIQSYKKRPRLSFQENQGY